MTIIVYSIITFLIATPIIYSIMLSRRHAAEIARIHDDYRKQKAASADKQRAVVKGQLAEQLFPLSDNCRFALGDMRFLGDFCDYIAVDGYIDCKDGGDNYIRSITFIEIKTGKSQLSRHQKLIRDAVQQGRVAWETIHLN